jgi:hypothetical protein
MVLDGDSPVDVGVNMKAISNTDRGDEPAPDPVNAPKGWRRDRKTGEWVARKRSTPGDEEREEIPERPDSAWADGPDGQELGDDERGKSPVVLTGDQRADLEGILELLALPAVSFIDARDPYCGGVVVEHWDNIRDKAVPVICRSPALMEWLTKAGGARDWLMLAAAVRPVGQAVWSHHITHTVSVEEDQAGGPVRGEELGAYPA